MAQALNLRCSGDHPHEVVQGQATGLSAMYSAKLARRIAAVVVPTKNSEGGDPKIPGSRHAGAPPPGKPEAAAEDYLECLLTHEWQEGGLEKALSQGNLLLAATGGVSNAAAVLRAVGREKLGNHFADIGDSRLDEALDADLLAYARTVAEKGIRACYQGGRDARITADAPRRIGLPE